MQIEPLPAFEDNYIWLLVEGRQAAVVDPGDAAPVLRELQRRGLSLADIVVTHHHGDHVGGVAELLHGSGARCIAPATPRFGRPDLPVREATRFDLLGESLETIEVPGHTLDHVAFHAPAAGALFCGDTLFGCGCGRLFEGTAAQMLHSLSRLAALPGATRVYCAHEYTLTNIRFALGVEPGNERLRARQREGAARRARGEPTVPSTIELERATNPFLRCDEPAVREAAGRFEPGAGESTLATFAALRKWRNGFR